MKLYQDLYGWQMPVYVLIVPVSPKFHSILLYDRSFLTQLSFLVSPWGTMVNLKLSKKENIVKNRELKI